MSDASPENQPVLHNTFNAEVYVQQTAQLLNLAIPPDQMASVVENFERIQVIAQPVLVFSLPDSLEAAPRFEP